MSSTPDSASADLERKLPEKVDVQSGSRLAPEYERYLVLHEQFAGAPKKTLLRKRGFRSHPPGDVTDKMRSRLPSPPDPVLSLFDVLSRQSQRRQRQALRLSRRCRHDIAAIQFGAYVSLLHLWPLRTNFQHRSSSSWA